MENSAQLKCHMCRQPVHEFAINVLATVEAECYACSGKFKLNSAKEHIQQCPAVEVDCHLCGERLRRADEDAHSQVCPMKEIICSCGDRVKREEVRSHEETTCQLAEVPCPLNCSEMVKR